MQDETNKQEDQLLVLARQFVELKVPFAEASYKEELAADAKEMIDKTIRMELVNAMNPEQIESYKEMLEQDNVTEDMIIGFVQKCGISVDEVTQIALTKFRMAYLGA